MPKPRSDEQPLGGWIKVYRSMVDHGHLQMPDNTFKLWIYLLLTVNHKASNGCAPGEGWITYRMIREACRTDGQPPWADSTINRSLDYLEDHGYIKRIHTKRGGPQRIRIVNWAKYQQDSSSMTQEVPQEVLQEAPQEPALEKQQCKEGQEAAEPAAVPIPPDLVSTLQRQVSSRLVLLQIADAVKLYGEQRVRFAGARVEEERRHRAKEGREALRNPVARFFAILRASTEAEAKAYFEEQAGAGWSSADDEDGPPPEDDDPIARRAREQLRQLVEGQRSRPSA